jgi:hypothetical protein
MRSIVESRGVQIVDGGEWVGVCGSEKEKKEGREMRVEKGAGTNSGPLFRGDTPVHRF